MSGSASMVWALPFTARVIRAMDACLPWDAARRDRVLSRIGRCAPLAIANGSRVWRLVEGAGIGNTLTQLCCRGDSRASSRRKSPLGLTGVARQRAHRGQEVAHLAFRNAAGDEHEPARAILAGPGRELDRRVGEVLDH